MAVRLDGDKARGKTLAVEFQFTDLNERYRLEISNSVLRHYRLEQPGEVDASLVLTRPMFDRIILGDVGLSDALFSDELSLEGSKLKLIEFFGLLDSPTGTFTLVTP